MTFLWVEAFSVCLCQVTFQRAGGIAVVLLWAVPGPLPALHFPKAELASSHLFLQGCEGRLWVLVEWSSKL